MAKRPIQFFLDREDRALLERLAERLGLSMAETLRLALRRYAAEELGEEDSLMKLMGIIDDPRIPADLSTRHDEYFVAGYPALAPRVAEEERDAGEIE